MLEQVEHYNFTNEAAGGNVLIYLLEESCTDWETVY